MTKIVRRPRSERAFFLEVPNQVNHFARDSTTDERGEKLYREIDMAEAVSAAIARGRQQATQEYESYRDELHRGYERALDTLETAVGQFREAQSLASRDLGVHVLELSRQMAEAIVRRELPRSPETIVALLDEALTGFASVGEVTLRVHPADAPVVLEIREREPERWPSFRVQADGGMTQGGCIVETEAGCLDGTVETQLNQLFEKIRQLEDSAREGDLGEEAA